MPPYSKRRIARAAAVTASVAKEQVDAALPQALFITFALMASAAVATSLGFLLV